MKQTNIIMKPSWLRQEEQRQQKLQIFTLFTILVLFAMGVHSFQMTPLSFHSTRSYSKISSYSTFSFSFHVKKSVEDDASKHFMDAAAISNDDDNFNNDDDAAVVDHHATSTTATTLETNGQRQDHDDTSWNSSTSATSTSTGTKNNTPSGIAASHSRYGSLLEEIGLLDSNGIGGGGGVKSLESLPSKRIVSKNEVFCNRELKLGNIRAIGFDMDYTIAQYKQPAFDKLAFDGAKEKLVNKLGYPVKLLDVEYDHTVSVVRTTGVR